MDQYEDIRTVFRRYLADHHSAEDLLRILEYFGEESNKGELTDLIRQALESPVEIDEHIQQDAIARLDTRVFRSIKQRTRERPFYRRWYFRVAAAILLCSAVGTYFLLKEKEQSQQQETVAQNDAAPASGKATLTLSDGRVIGLDDQLEDEISSDAGVTILSLQGEGLRYQVPVNPQQAASAHNTLTTPNGGTYQLTLSDGTKVWLNAATQLRYPVRFSDKTRLVKLTGEAYFEVAKDRQRPFVVESPGQQVQVLGTHFNINAYPQEGASITTLLEGSVSVTETRQHSTRLLTPGSQAQVQGSMVTTRPVDAQAALAWKQGQFRFQRTNMKAMLREIGRWYDVEVDTAGIPEKQFNGTLPRQVRLSELTRMIEKTSGVKLQIKERRLFMER